MRSSDREEIVGDLDALDADFDRLAQRSFEALTVPELLNLLDRWETMRRRMPVIDHGLINQLAARADKTQLGGTLPRALADRLRITPAEAGRRVTEAAELGPRRALTGEPLEPVLTATAAAQREGTIGATHVKVIRTFMHRLPTAVDFETREKVESHLAQLATEYRPDQAAKLADRLTDCLNPDGDYTDEDRARRRGLTMSVQDNDGMSRLFGWITPELRALLEKVWAKLAAPGMCNPDDQTPVIDGAADEKAVTRDGRSNAQRNHDALSAAFRALLASGELGQHNGLPVTVIVSTTLKELEQGAGKALTGGGSLLPMSDVIRMGRHAHHYLAIFDQGKPIGLYHTKRLASPGQRIVLYAKDRGCTRPGCDVPGYWCEVDHVDGWAATGRTDIDSLTLACGPDNRLKEKGWTTRKNAHGETEWIPPPHLDHGQPRTNSYHHPEELLCEDDEDDP